jgi:hypothetical protein
MRPAPPNGLAGSNGAWSASPPSPAWRPDTPPDQAQTCAPGFNTRPWSSMPVEYLAPAIEDRAAEVLTLLADRGQHRAPRSPA